MSSDKREMRVTSKLNTRKIHIVVYSRLDLHGGGRETWADYFLKSIRNKEEFESINVYCLGSETGKDTLIHKFKDDRKINFYPTEFSSTNRKLHRISEFTRVVTKNIKIHSNQNDLIIFLGAMMEGFVALNIWLAVKHKLKYLLWIRSIGLMEVATRQNWLVVLLLKCIEMIFFKISNAIVFNGIDTYDHYKNIYSKYINKMYVVENAVEFEKFSQVEPINLEDKYINIAYIGRFNKEKGFYDYLESIKKYNSKIDNEYESKIKFHIWGYGQDFNLPDNTIYHGVLERDSILEVFSKIQIIVFLNLSRRKMAGGLSHGLLEALACGRICIAYDNPAHTQVLNKTNSILTPESNVEMLSTIYDEIVRDFQESNKDKYIVMSNNGVNTAKKYTIETHIHKFMEVYKSL